MLKIKCIICGKEIRKPMVGQLCCSDKKCREEFNAHQLESLDYIYRRGGKNGNL